MGISGECQESILPNLFFNRSIMTKRTIKATTIEQQKNKLKGYGVVMNDDAFADYALRFIGYYHLGFYLFPFEKTYPYVDGRRRHEVIDGTTIEDVVALHDFDCDLRCILMKYLTHIELAFRNSVIYHLSQKYPNKPCWYLDKTIVDADVVDSIIADYDTIKRNDAIKHHHKKHRKSKYAPAWKTLEFETLGTIHKLYDGILRTDDKLPINRQFNVPNVDIFSNYIDSLRHLRNACAHGNIVMEIKLTRAISKGPAGNFIGAKRHRLIGLLELMKFFLSHISPSLVDGMRRDLGECFMNFFISNPKAKNVVEDMTKVNVADFS